MSEEMILPPISRFQISIIFSSCMSDAQILKTENASDKNVQIFHIFRNYSKKIMLNRKRWNISGNTLRSKWKIESIRLYFMPQTGMIKKGFTNYESCLLVGVVNKKLKSKHNEPVSNPHA